MNFKFNKKETNEHKKKTPSQKIATLIKQWSLASCTAIVVVVERKRGEGIFYHFLAFFTLWSDDKCKKVTKFVRSLFRFDWLSIFIEWRNDLCGFTVCLNTITHWMLKEKTTRKIWTHSHLRHSHWIFSALLLLLPLLFILFRTAMCTRIFTIRHSLQWIKWSRYLSSFSYRLC